MTLEPAKVQLSAMVGVQPPSNFGLAGFTAVSSTAAASPSFVQQVSAHKPGVSSLTLTPPPPRR